MGKEVQGLGEKGGLSLQEPTRRGEGTEEGGVSIFKGMISPGELGVSIVMLTELILKMMDLPHLMHLKMRRRRRGLMGRGVSVSGGGFLTLLVDGASMNGSFSLRGKGRRKEEEGRVSVRREEGQGKGGPTRI